MGRPKITICIPTFNRENYIEQTLKCVVKQTMKPFRTIVIDNASTDNTKEIVKSYRTFGIEYIRNKKNLGMVGNLNKCIELAETKFFTILPSDDLISVRWYESWINILEKVDADFYTSPLTVVGSDNYIQYRCPIFHKSRYVAKSKVMKEFCDHFAPGIPPNAANIYTKNLFSKIPLFDPQEGTEADVRVGMNIFREARVYYHHDFLFYFRNHKERSFDLKEESKTDTNDQKKLEHYFSILKEIYKKDFGAHPKYWYIIQSHIFMTLGTINLYIIKGNFNKIRKTYALVFKYFPMLFHSVSDYFQFVKFQSIHLKRALYWTFIPKKLRGRIQSTC